jgi:DNA polymerase-3 subunit beta
MNITIQREELMKPLAFVAGVVERRQTLPILANVLLRFEGDTLVLTGTDLEVEVIARSTAATGQPGEMTVAARKLLDICRALPAKAKLEIRQEKEKAVIKSGSSRFSLLTMPAGDFPSIETAQWDQTIAVRQQDLRMLLSKTHFCMAQQDVRYYLNGLLMELTEGRLRTVATDGHRLALAEAALASGGGPERQVIVPRKGVQELMRFLEDSAETVELQLSANHLRANLRELTFTSKLIDGRFPDYNKVIPAQHTRKVETDRVAVLDTLNRVAILSNEKYRGARITLSSGRMSITAHNPEQEEAREEVEVTYQGEEMEIGFNVNYVAEAINALESEQVEFGLTDANSSCTIRTPGTTGHLYVVMPMRL